MPANWTDEQNAAINAAGRAIVVSAAAGSGKTAVLVEKLRRILSDEKNKTPADKIVVVTFTNDAAAQMKQRLSKALTEELEQSGSDWIAEQLALIPAAKISTIHSFCFDLIRENSGLAGVDPGFGILTPDDEEIIVAKACANVFERWFSSRRSDMTRLTSFFCPGESSDRHFSEIIPLLRTKILALPFPRDYMDGVADMYRDPPEDLQDLPMVKMYGEYIAENLMLAANVLEKVYDELAVTANASDILSYKDEYEAVRHAAGSAKKRPESLFEAVPVLNFELVKTIPAKLLPKDESGKKVDKTLQDALKKLRDDAIKICCDLCIVTMNDSKKGTVTVSEPKNAFSLKNIRDDLAVHADICRRLFALMKDVMDEERRLKEEKNGLGFSDAEQIACGLLCEKDGEGKIIKTPLAKALSDYYHIVMIDEFQDSTAVQEMIFRNISKDGSAERAGTNFFAVGDVKQSIYRFRCADPRIFTANIRQSVPYKDDGGKEPAYILLNKNFRSSGYVVDFVNMIFDGIMSEKFGGIDYGAGERLVRGAEIADDFGPAEIIAIPKPEKDGGSKAGNADHICSEAKCVAHRIKQLLECDIHDGDAVRKVRPSDICILSRKSKYFPLYAAALRELGIPAEGTEESGCLTSPEVLTLINLLRAMDNPTLDIPMTAALMSPLFMFTAEDMGHIRTAGDGSVYANISAIAAGAAEIDGSLFPDGFREKCGKFSALFGEFRKYAVTHSAEELICFICDSTDFISAVSVSERGAAGKLRIRRFISFAAGYDKNGAGGLSGFVRQVNLMLERGKDIEGNAASGENCVAVKTIHSSKGLEYPFVFLCGTWEKFRSEDKASGIRTVSDRISFFPDHGAAFYINKKDAATGEITGYDSFPRRAVVTALDKAASDEEMMILYVALTRAKHKLFITRRSDPAALRNRKCMSMLRSGGKQDLALWQGESFADWISAVLTDEKISELEAEGNMTVTVHDSLPESDAETEESTETAPDGEYSESIAAQYDKLMTSDYDLALSQTSAKLTVSEIAKKHISEEDRIFTPEPDNNAAPRIKGVSASARGTAVHAFMQHADFERLYASRNDDLFSAVAEEARRISAAGLMSEVQAKCADPRVISAFVKSGLFDRMMRSPEIMREKKFLVKISDLMLDDSDFLVYNGTMGMLQGVADCIFREDGGYVLVDYKTDRRVTEEMLTERYRRQLELYAAAFSLILDAPVTKAYLYSFSLGREIYLPLQSLPS